MRARRLLVLAEGQLGDLLLLMPTLRGLRSSLDDVELTVCVAQRQWYTGDNPGDELLGESARRGGSADVLLDSGLVDHVLEVNRTALRARRGLSSLRAEAHVVRRLRQGRYDMVLCTFGQDRFTWWAFACGASVRIGQRRQSLWPLLTHRPDVTREQLGVCAYYAALAEAGGAHVASLETEYRVPEDARSWARARLEEAGVSAEGFVVAVHPGASGPHKTWPLTYYAALIDVLQQEHDAEVVLLGAPYDRHKVESICRLATTSPLVLDQCTIAQLGAILEQSHVLVSNDSGPRHLAIAVGSASIAVMLNRQAQAWKIWEDSRDRMVLQSRRLGDHDRDCPHRDDPFEEVSGTCLCTIPVDEVLKHVLAVRATRM